MARSPCSRLAMNPGSSRYPSRTVPSPAAPAYETRPICAGVCAVKRSHTTRLSSGAVNSAWSSGPRYSCVLVCIIACSRFWLSITTCTSPSPSHVSRYVPAAG